MQTNSIPKASQPKSKGAQKANVKWSTRAGHSVNPMTLTTLDFGLFRSLCSLGTNSERICAALCISQSDFEYISNLSGVSLTR
jgi:hypothetical protein